MRKLVQVGDGESQLLGKSGRLSLIQVELVVSNQTNVLHCSCVVLWDKDLVVLVEWVLSLEEIIVEPHARLGDVKHQLVVYFLHQALSCPDAHLGEAFSVALEVPIVASADCVEVSRDLE